MKIVHFSDTHLGFSDLDVVNHDGINQREADFYKAFSDVIDAILDIKPDYVIHTGDLFHRASPSNRAITFALKELKRLGKDGIPLIMIAGNHSTPKTLSASPILEAFTSQDHIQAVYSQRYEKIEFEDVIFHALPHINDPHIIDDELNKMEKNIDPKKKNILMMHCSVGSYYLMHEFGEWVYPKDKEYIFEKLDYVALGHWHGFSQVGKHTNVFYSGSTERTSSSDKRDDKGYVVVELDEKLKVFHHPVQIRKSLEFKIDAQNFETEVASLNLSEIDDALVEVKLYNLTSSTSIDITNKEISKIFDKALYVRVKREFEIQQDVQIEENIESVSLEGYFLSHIKGKVSDKKEAKRLLSKAKELFAMQRDGDDTN